MGTWGYGIFADDESQDVRSDYRKKYLAEAQSDALATENIAREYEADFNDPGCNTAFWLGLAATQWKMGRLDSRVKTLALRIIDEGMDLRKWEENQAEMPKRAKALAQLRAMLDSPQPAAKPIPKKPKPLPVQLAGWKTNEVIGVRMPNGRLALLRMIAYFPSSAYKVQAPVVEILNWTRTDMPAPAELQQLTYINWCRINIRRFYILASPKRAPVPEEIFIRTGFSLPKITQSPDTIRKWEGGYATLFDEASPASFEKGLSWILEPYWENPSLPPHHPGFDKPEANLFPRFTYEWDKETGKRTTIRILHRYDEKTGEYRQAERRIVEG